MKLRKDLCASSFIKLIFRVFSSVPDRLRTKSSATVTLADCLMACYAVFSLKWASLLQYDIRKRDQRVARNLKNLFLIKNPPSDTYMRERLDELDPAEIRPAFKKIFAVLQRSKDLESYRYIDNCYLVSIDGTGHFSSSKVHCKNCCVKKYHDGQVLSYYHQMLSAVVVHPEHSHVIPLCPEPIINQENASKNDCEQNASRRLLEHIRREHPHLKIAVVQDALSDCGPNVKQLESLSMKYIIVRKGDPLRWGNQEIIETFECEDEQGILHKYRFRNGDCLNASHRDIKTNVFEHSYVDKKGKKRYGCWITNILITKTNVRQLMKGGRARWKIENETFNTLKNQGYNFEHNYGHGKANLCTVMSFAMLLAFLVDQAQQICCELFKAAKKERRTFYELWEAMRAYFRDFVWDSWEEFLSVIAQLKTINSS